MSHVGWIGLGSMGLPMAENLAKAGYDVRAYNRTNRPFDDIHIELVSTPSEVASGASIVFLMVTDGRSTREVLFGDNGCVEALQAGTLVVNMSTIGVEETKEIGLVLANRGVEYMDAPVSGSVQPARQGQLVILAGGSDAAFQKAQPMFEVLGRKAHHLGVLGSGSAVKLMVNAMLGLTIEATSECLTLADKSGIGRQRLLDVLSDTGVWSPVMSGKRPAWEDNDTYPAAFSLKNMTKDLRLAGNYAADLSTPMPALSAALAVFLAAQASGLAEADMAAVLQQLRKMASIE